MAFLMIWVISSIGCFLAIPDRHNETWLERGIRSVGYGLIAAGVVGILSAGGCSGGGGNGEYRFSS